MCSIKDDWSFDDEVAAEYGCVVRTFDPRLVNVCTVENQSVVFISGVDIQCEYTPPDMKIRNFIVYLIS